MVGLQNVSFSRVLFHSWRIVFFTALPGLAADVPPCWYPDPYRQGVCLHGLGLYAEAFAALQPAAERGQAGAQLVISDMYAAGEGVVADRGKAIYWAERAFYAGKRDAAMRLAAHYASDRETRVEYVAWLTIAAAEGRPAAMVFLGDFFLDGRGDNKSSCLALHWYQQALKLTALETTIYKLDSKTLSAVADKAGLAEADCPR